MGTTADKLNKLLETKAAIKQAIIDKGVDISDTDTFASYPEKIESIQAGGDSVDLANIATGNGTNGEYAFYKWDIEELDLSTLDTSNMTAMNYMFGGCSKLTNIDTSGFNTSNITNMSYMFRDCNKIKTLDLSGFDTSNVTNMSYMFGACYSLTSIDVSHFDTRSLTNISSMFTNCGGLTTLDCSNFDLIKCTITSSIGGAFNHCTKLVDFYPPQNICQGMRVDKSTALSHDSLVRIINNLTETRATKTLTLGTTNLAKLSDEEKAIATNKGWTLA